MEKSKKIFVGRIRFNVIARIGRIKGVEYGSKIEAKDTNRE